MKTRKLNVFQRLLVLLVLSGSLISLAWLVPSAGDAGRPVATPGHQVATVIPSTAKDTTVPGQKPAVALPMTPPPPPPAIPSPPPPPPQDTAAATFSLHGSVPPAMSDSLAYAIANATKSYFASKEWKEYQQKLVEYATKMAEVARQYGPQMQAFGDSMRRYFHGPEWEKYREDLQRNAQSLNAYFKSPEWNDQVKAIRQQAEKIGEQFSNLQVQNRTLDSMKAHMLFRNGLTLAAPGHALDPDQVAGMLKQDGLISDRSNFRLRLNERGLFVNGKKQDRKYFEKYRSLFGPDTRVEIKRKNGNTDTSISTHKESSESH